MTLAATEFIRRVLLHVLPRGFHRMRYYGLLANRTRHQHVAQCRQLLGTRSATRPDATPVSIDYRDRYHALTGRSLRLCPPVSRRADAARRRPGRHRSSPPRFWIRHDRTLFAGRPCRLHRGQHPCQESWCAPCGRWVRLRASRRPGAHRGSASWPGPGPRAGRYGSPPAPAPPRRGAGASIGRSRPWPSSHTLPGPLIMISLTSGSSSAASSPGRNGFRRSSPVAAHSWPVPSFRVPVREIRRQIVGA